MKDFITNIDRQAIKDFFRTDKGIFLISMSISLVFWLLVKLSKNYKTQREVTIEYDIADDMAFENLPPEKIGVTFGGRGWDLMYDYFKNRNRTIHFDLTENNLESITDNQLKAKINASISSNEITVETSADNIPIELSKSVSKTIPVLLQSEISFAPNHHLKSPIRLRPDSVILTGPTQLLETYTAWETEKLVFLDLQNTIKQPLALRRNERPQLQLSSTIIQVQIPVEQFTEKSIFLPVIVKNAPDSLKVFPNKVKTNFVVGLSRYDSIDVQDFQLEVDLKNIPIHPTKNTAPILLTKQPAEVKNIQYSPKSVSFLIVKEQG